MIGGNASDVLPNIDWGVVYDKIGMESEYRQFCEQNNFVEIPCAWTVPVIAGVTCNHLMAVFNYLNIRVCKYAYDLDKEVTTKEVRGKSYVVRFRRRIDADVENADCSAVDLISRYHRGMAPKEWFLLDLGCFLTFKCHLDSGNSTTICPNFLFPDKTIPGLDWDSSMRVITIFGYEIKECQDGILRSRTAFLHKIPAH